MTQFEESDFRVGGLQSWRAVHELSQLVEALQQRVEALEKQSLKPEPVKPEPKTKK